MPELQQREQVVTESRTWLGTPFLHGARLKAIGADCETFLCEVFRAAGVFDAQGIPYVPEQWFLNTKEELYLNYLGRYATEYQRPKTPWDEGYAEFHPQPGDIICVKHRYVYSHAAIVIQWPRVIHCHPPFVMESDVFSNPVFASGDLKFFNPWARP
jgi:cell wall-associated NlpC family hydrolase